jgi:hypothetical protein
VAWVFGVLKVSQVVKTAVRFEGSGAARTSHIWRLAAATCQIWAPDSRFAMPSDRALPDLSDVFLHCAAEEKVAEDSRR